MHVPGGIETVLHSMGIGKFVAEIKELLPIYHGRLSLRAIMCGTLASILSKCTFFCSELIFTSLPEQCRGMPKMAEHRIIKRAMNICFVCTHNRNGCR